MPRLNGFAKPCLALAALTLIAAPVLGADKPWIRSPAISPDGKQLAFRYRGDLWLVSSSGGRARLLTSHVGFETDPIWSPDSTLIAFASDRHGQFDAFVVEAGGGAPLRLTHHSASDRPACFSRDGAELLFSSARLDAPGAALPSASLGELYAISVKGGRPRQLLTTPAESARLSPDGRLLAYHDRKGYENVWRKHHVSSVARDIWIYDLATKTHRRVTGFRGEDRNPMWSPDGKGLVYLSERGGSFNIWQRAAHGDDEPVQVTRHAPHPVRSLSIADDGTLAYNYNGEVWIRPPAAAARRLDIELVADLRTNPVEAKTYTRDATEMALAPGGEEVAFVVRGEVFVASLAHGTTRRITDTPEQERNLSWAPNGRELYYAGERGGSWNIYKTRLGDPTEAAFHRATLLEESAVLVSDNETFQPAVSPDGARIAFLQDRDAIAVMDLASGARKVVVSADNIYSYSDGDVRFHWSPDGRWLAFGYLSHRRWIEDIGVVDIAKGTIINITESGYNEGGAWWSPDGRALLFISDRYGRRSHGSWGSDGDVMAWYLSREAYDRARLNEEDFSLLLEKEKKAKADKKEDKKEDKKGKGQGEDKDGATAGEKPDPIEPLAIEFERRRERLRRMTLHSAPVGDYALSPDGEALVYFAQVESRWDLWVSRWRASATRKLVAYGDRDGGELAFAKDGKTLVVRRGDGRIEALKLGGALSKEGGSPKRKPVGYAAAMDIDRPAERAHLFEHVWRQARAKFYKPDLHGADWLALKANYAAFLPTINNNHDFAELLSELLGELNASHTGSGYRLRPGTADQTAALGLLYDTEWRGPGLRIAEVLAGGPADRAELKIEAGLILTKINGVALGPTVNTARLLNGQAGKRVRLALKDPRANTSRDAVIKPISLGAERGLRYERWVKARRALTEKLSGGRVGYVHVRSMNDASFRRVYQETLGLNSDKDALVVDTRFNGGGWLHEDLVAFLDGEKYSDFLPRGKKLGRLGGEPNFRWTRPVAVVQSEGNYSDAHIFPYAFKQLKVGKLVGSPVPGTGTAVWWETLIDKSLYFGIPQVGNLDLEGRYLENLELQPDILVLNDPQSMARGEDKQLVAAVEALLEEIEAR